MHAVLAIVVNAFKLLFLPYLLYRRRRAAPDGAWLTVRVDGRVAPCLRPARPWDGGDRALNLHALREAARIARHDPRVVGLLVDMRRLQGGSASAIALRDALATWKLSGKRLIVYLPRGGGARHLIAASVADRIVAAPGSEIAPLGFAVEAPYVKDALDRLGLEAEVLAQGRYKTAGEFLVADSMSDAQREQVGRLLDVFWDQLLESLSQGRSVDKTRAQQWIDEGPWLASEAQSQGIIDEVAYWEDLLRSLGPDGKEEAPTMPVVRYVRRRRVAFRPFRRPKRIAVVEVRGPIVSEQSQPWLPMAVESQVCSALRMARKSPSVRGAVVFVDSRGGSASASERMLHEMRLLAAEKPVIACMGDAAASGGYMVAVGAHGIVAQPTTVTGSIGVVSARVVAGKLMQRLGIRTQTVKRGARADMMSASRRLDEGEHAAMQRVMGTIYGEFVGAVAEGRDRPVEEIEMLASGRVWSGVDALEHGLVDRLGGFEVALEEVRKRIGPAGNGMEPMPMAPRGVPTLPSVLRGLGFSKLFAPSWELGKAMELIVMSAMAHERVWAWSPWAEVEE
jgi:protease-4